MRPFSELFHPQAAAAVREAIAEAGGNEVFFVGRRGAAHPIGSVEVLARGHSTAVPALLRLVRPGEAVIHNHPSGNLTPSEADLGIASEGGSLGIAFLIVDSEATRAYVVVEPMEAKERHPIVAGEIAALLGSEGPISRALPGYEHRPEQIAMAEEVARAFNDESVLFVEAGTGTGKSLAYLLPAILHATRNRERVVVSTNTINLQEQLLGKDLPFLRETLGLEFRSVLLKGRSNYLCLRKADFARGDADRLLDAPGREVLGSLLEWSAKTTDGSRSDLPFIVPEAVWEEVSSDADDCMRVKSPHYSRCFFFQSRREAASADVLLVNHHLLMADLATRAATGDYTGTAVLPPYAHVILDEAHNLEDVASSYFGTAVTALGVLKSLGRLQSERDERQGVLPALEDAIEGWNDVGEALGEALELRRALAATVREEFRRISTDALGWLGLDQTAGTGGPGGEELKVRLKPDVLRHPAFAEGILPACRKLTSAIGDFTSALSLLLERARRRGEGAERLASALLRIEALRGRLEGAAEVLATFPELDEGACRWVELRRLRNGEIAARLASAPLEVAPLLAERVFAKMKTVVLTSATLTVAKRFDHFAERLGATRIARKRLRTARFDSPFDYPRQALLVVPTDMPEPQEPRFAEAVRETIEQAVTASRGRAFLLFTSYTLLERTHRALAPRLERQGLVALRQGSAPRDALLTRFRREPGAVLFAVDSFWEGVDVAGEALSLVVLVRLPFKVPTEPLQEARVEAIERKGGDPFHEYALPQAVIKLRQGFGRLIRSREDRGAVLILDPRVSTKRYGRLFLESLPPARRVEAPRARALPELDRFFRSLEEAAREPGPVVLTRERRR